MFEVENFSFVPCVGSRKCLSVPRRLIVGTLKELWKCRSYMDPHAFVQISISGLALRFGGGGGGGGGGGSYRALQSDWAPFVCKIKVPGNPTQTVETPLHKQESRGHGSGGSSSIVTFYLDENAFLEKSTITKAAMCASRGRPKKPCIRIRVLAGKGREKQRLRLGKFKMELDPQWLYSSPCVDIHNGWVAIDKHKNKAQLHLNIKSEPHPRYIFRFDGQPEESPLVLQSRGSIHQPIFTCKFSRERESRFRWEQQQQTGVHHHHSWMIAEKEKNRKGWLIVIHDLSGSAVAAASMVTPFVPSGGTHHVSHSNPGAWLILVHAAHSWLPLGRLEAWREHSDKAQIGCSFKLIDQHQTHSLGPPLSPLNQLNNNISTMAMLLSRSAIKCHRGKGDSVKMSVELPIPGGFVMAAQTMNDKKTSKAMTTAKYCTCGRRRRARAGSTKLQVQLGLRYVKSLSDAAVFMAVAAAVDLSVDACRSFSRRLTTDLALSCAWLS